MLGEISGIRTFDAVVEQRDTSEPPTSKFALIFQAFILSFFPQD